MAVIIGTLGRNTLRGVASDATSFIVGDPFTAEAFFDPTPGTSATLSSGRGGNDLILGTSSETYGYGDAYAMEGTGRGGNDRLIGGDGPDDLIGDAYNMRGSAVGGQRSPLGRQRFRRSRR